jgi:PIN domain nuclease of toxin-antitoxin system
LLDTHIWIWWVGGDLQLPRRIAEALDALRLNEDNSLQRTPSISDVSLWETAMLVSRGRFAPPEPFADWVKIAAASYMVRVLPVSPEVATEFANLPSHLHKDPADRLIIATCRAFDLPLVTMDDRIRKSGLVSLWKP